jgi:pterin-4a-carbinolamine dehydratase
MRQWIDIIEGKFRSNSLEEFIPNKESLNDLKSKFLPDWEMLDHRILKAQYVAQDHRQAEEFIEHINDLSEKLDHFAKVTQDVAEVTVETTTFDVEGLTILDFQLALAIDDYARKNDIEQKRMLGNFD